MPLFIDLLKDDKQREAFEKLLKKLKIPIPHLPEKPVNYALEMKKTPRGQGKANR